MLRDFIASWGAVDQAIALLETSEITHSDKPNASTLNCIQGKITFDQVKFHYKGTEPLFQNKSIEIKAGQKVGLVGYSGGGKSTFVNLILRLYDVTDGSIELNGIDIREYDLESLRMNIGVVMQDAHLFHETIEENLKYAKPDATLAEMEEACRSAQIWTLIASLPQGLSTMVGERGHRLSGGERQRLAIARLLLKSPSLVILDEATAHLDSENEDLVQIALKNALQGRTSIVIAHRLSTVMDADQILVIRDGAVAEKGRHEELIGAGGIYSDLFSRQDLTAR